MSAQGQRSATFAPAVTWRGRRGRRRSRPVLALVVVACVAFAAMAIVAVATHSAEDATVYYLAAHVARDGGDPYHVSTQEWDRLAADHHISNYQTPYRYPPLTAALFVPFSWLPWPLAVALFEALSVAALVGGALLVGQVLGGGRAAAAALVALLLCGPAWHTLYVGQVNAVVFFCLALALWGMSRHDEARGSALGPPLGARAAEAFGLAAGAALKVLPAALIALQAWRRQWRRLVESLAALAVLLAGSMLVLNPRTVFAYPAAAWRLTEPDRVQNSPGIDTFTAVIGRLTLPWPGSSDATTVAHVHLVALVLTLMLVAATAGLAWPRRGHASPAVAAERSRLLFCLVLCATLVVGPFTFYHQYVLLLIPLLVVGRRLVDEGRGPLLAVVVGLFLLLGVQQILWVVARQQLLDSGWWRLLDVPFVLTLTLWAACAWELLGDVHDGPRGAYGRGGGFVGAGSGG